MKTLILAMVALFGYSSFADGTPTTLTCYQTSYQVVCTDGQCPPPPPATTYSLGTIPLVPAADGTAQASFQVNVGIFGRPATLSAQGRYTVGDDGAALPTLDMELTDSNGWTYSNFSGTEIRTMARLSSSFGQQGPGGQVMISQSDFLCQLN